MDRICLSKAYPYTNILSITPAFHFGIPLGVSPKVINNEILWVYLYVLVFFWGPLGMLGLLEGIFDPCSMFNDPWSMFNNIASQKVSII
jgi:hypothetical protein